jgi:hypothetical protein
MAILAGGFSRCLSHGLIFKKSNDSGQVRNIDLFEIGSDLVLVLVIKQGTPTDVDIFASYMIIIVREACFSCEAETLTVD